MFYELDIWDDDGKCIEPGYFEGPLYRSETAIPIPNVGEIIETIGDRKFRVNERVFSYGSLEDGSDTYLHTRQVDCLSSELTQDS